MTEEQWQRLAWLPKETFETIYKSLCVAARREATDRKRTSRKAKRESAFRQRAEVYGDVVAARMQEQQRRSNAGKALRRSRNHNYHAAKRSGLPAGEQVHEFVHFVYTAKRCPCYWCGRPRIATIEHLLPLSRGGRHELDNVQAACWECNNLKNSRTVEEYTNVLKNKGLVPAYDDRAKQYFLSLVPS